MRTKIFKGESLPALLSQVREECGEHVVILNTRERGSREVEVEVGVGAHPSVHEEIQEEREVSLDLLADLSQEDDAMEALAAQGISSDIRAFCDKYLLKKGDRVENLTKALSKVLVFDGTVPFRSRCVVFVGPKQSGKTTTLVKLAARLQEALVCKIGIVSAEALSREEYQRLAAYAELLEIPLASTDHGVELYQQIPEAVARLEACDLILIDTPGVEARDEENQSRLEQLLSSCREMEKLLVLSAAQDAVSLRIHMQRFAAVDPSRLVLTRVDECGFLGAAINAAYASELPLGFMSSGDRVPHDIQPASARWLAGLLLRRMH